jgi:hypothetical protein
VSRRAGILDDHAAGRRNVARPRWSLTRGLLRNVVVAAGLLLTLALVDSPVLAEWAELTLPSAMPAAERDRLIRIGNAASVGTRVEGEFLGQRDLFEFLLDRPAFASELTQALKFARLRIWPAPEGYFLDEGWGTTGVFRTVYATDGTRIFYARGQHKVSLLPPITGEAVVVIDYHFAPGSGGRELIKTAVAGFVKLDNRFLAGALRMGSTLVQKKADREASGLTRLFTRVSRAIEEDPAAVYAKLRGRPGVPPGELEEFRVRLGLR